MMRSTSILFVCAAIFSGCVTPLSPTGYYWGNYSRTLYEYTKTPTDSTRQAHENTLKGIINTVDQGRGKVPPGIFTELGKMNMDRGNFTEARKYFELEATHYPESALLVKTLMAKVGGQ
jgi:hypothetical protein